MVFDGTTVSNCVYIVHSDFINAYGMQMRNLSAGTLSGDAATVGQLNAAIGDINSVLDAINGRVV